MSGRKIIEGLKLAKSHAQLEADFARLSSAYETLAAANVKLWKELDDATYALEISKGCCLRAEEVEEENQRLRAALEKIESETAATWVQDVARAALEPRVSDGSPQGPRPVGARGEARQRDPKGDA